ncbi:hypothetical protein PDJAM_G00217900 [Pangasius djambal]|uniref:Uncharacterized protein n=1 Tax=Pangasius djambal TaxID=1691987 RepID=A0ACC5YBG1_9TELE|nr:hypothetical protein [Pangasius djambal]
MKNEGCAALASALCLNPSHLRELELSGNTLRSGMKQLCDVLQHQHFKLLKLGLCMCSLTEGDCAAVVAALRTNPSHLKELDLSENTVGSTGVKELSDLLQNSNCALEILKILSPEAEEACDSLTEVLGINPLLQTDLDLSGKIYGDSVVKQLSVLLKDPQCRTEKLRLSKSGITPSSCANLISALTSKHSHLTELDLSENTLGNPGVDKISTLLKNSSCKLQKLVLSDCRITGEGYAALVKALKSSHLIELDLGGNDPGESGVKELRNLMNDTKCKLKTLRLSGCNLTEKRCSPLLSALRSVSSTLKELNLSNNKIQDSGVKLLSEELKMQHCKLETVRLSDCSITEEGYAALAVALKSNRSSHLKELDLRGNDPGASGVNLLTDLLQYRNNKLTLR